VTVLPPFSVPTDAAARRDHEAEFDDAALAGTIQKVTVADGVLRFPLFVTDTWPFSDLPRLTDDVLSFNGPMARFVVEAAETRSGIPNLTVNRRMEATASIGATRLQSIQYPPGCREDRHSQRVN
jgi:hypothetical protein